MDVNYKKTLEIKRSFGSSDVKAECEIKQLNAQDFFCFAKRFHGVIMLSGLVEFFALIPKRLDLR